MSLQLTLYGAVQLNHQFNYIAFLLQHIVHYIYYIGM